MFAWVHVCGFTSAVEGAVTVEREREGEGGRVRVRRQAHRLVAHVVAHDERVVDPETPTVAARRRSVVATVTPATVAADPTQATESAAQKARRRRASLGEDRQNEPEHTIPMMTPSMIILKGMDSLLAKYSY